MSPPDLFLFLIIFLALLCFFKFNMDFRMSLSVSGKKPTGILIGIALTL